MPARASDLGSARRRARVHDRFGVPRAAELRADARRRRGRPPRPRRGTLPLVRSLHARPDEVPSGILPRVVLRAEQVRDREIVLHVDRRRRAHHDARRAPVPAAPRARLRVPPRGSVLRGHRRGLLLLHGEFQWRRRRRVHRVGIFSMAADGGVALRPSARHRRHIRATGGAAAAVRASAAAPDVAPHVRSRKRGARVHRGRRAAFVRRREGASMARLPGPRASPRERARRGLSALQQFYERGVVPPGGMDLAGALVAPEDLRRAVLRHRRRRELLGGQRLSQCEARERHQVPRREHHRATQGQAPRAAARARGRFVRDAATTDGRARHGPRVRGRAARARRA
mmetsp:Transcript_18950/g.65753  ORF Transcript_18950/g.65753 Transcript_18950/m.65753 type:complete len:343 (+) Transcript_18950:306-1334(+)